MEQRLASVLTPLKELDNEQVNEIHSHRYDSSGGNLCCTPNHLLDDCADNIRNNRVVHFNITFMIQLIVCLVACCVVMIKVANE